MSEATEGLGPPARDQSLAFDPAPAPDEETAGLALPPFHRRVFDVFVAPGRLGTALREHPAWAAALFSGVGLMLVQLLVIPMSVWTATFREAALQRGRPLPEGFAGGALMRVTSIVGGSLVYLIVALIMAGLVTLLFAFILGDEGRFKQYLSVLSHAWLIPAILGFLTVPLKIAQQNLKATLNLGNFFFFLPEGYVLKVLTMLDLTQIWAWLVVAAGVHAIDPKRSFKSAATTLIVLNVLFVMIFALFVPTP